MYMLENDIPFTQEFLDTLDALAEKGVTFELATSKPEESIPELELT